jgi:hypothetical protein
MKRLTAAQAKDAGFTVDRTTYPWLGYKGARFSPTESVSVLTDLESRLVEHLRQTQLMLDDATGLAERSVGVLVRKRIREFLEEV